MKDGKVRVGDAAPDFTLPDANGKPVCLHDYRGKASVVLYFYPKDGTAICTAQACSFRDNYETFRQAGVEVIGVSADSTASHRKFSERQRLPFRLISDVGGELRARYGVARTLWLLPGRATYLIDRAGIVRHICSAPFQGERHAAEVLSVLQEIQEEPDSANS